MHPGGHVWNTLYTILRRKSEATFILSKTRREYSPFTNSISLSVVKGHGKCFPNCWWCGLLPRIFCGRFAKRAHLKWYSNGVQGSRRSHITDIMLHQRDSISQSYKNCERQSHPYSYADSMPTDKDICRAIFCRQKWISYKRCKSDMKLPDFYSIFHNICTSIACIRTEKNDRCKCDMATIYGCRGHFLLKCVCIRAI